MNKVTSYCIIILLLLIGFQGSYGQDIQRVRIDFQSPSGYQRQLLLGFTPDNSASDGMDYGYDALCPDDLNEDLNWMINSQRYVIQGVGEYQEHKMYPFGLFSTNSGNIQISLNALENFENTINVFIYDAMSRTFHQINSTNFNLNIDSGEYLDRFFITFQNNTAPTSSYDALSIEDNSLDNLIIKNITITKELLIDTRNSLNINKVEILDILGKKVSNVKNINSSVIRISVQHINSKIIIVSVFTSKGIIRKKLLLN